LGKHHLKPLRILANCLDAQVVDGGRELEGTLVAVSSHARDAAWVDHPGPEDAGGLLRQAAGADRLGRCRVAGQDVVLRAVGGTTLPVSVP
jgi:hypothetical protein